MAFFRKFKFHYRHKKLSEEWALATSLNELSEMSENATCLIEKIGSADSTQNINTTTFELKYLGNTGIDLEKSEKSTAEAIKSVVSLSKNSKRKIIKVKVNISQKGVEVFNALTGENMFRVSIYKISYCSADAVNDHVFAFVGSDDNQITNYENLLCYVFYCPKRKIAHDVTLTVARSFEQAYQKWKEAVDIKMMQDEIKNNHNNKKLIEGNNILSKEFNKQQNFEKSNTNDDNKENNVEIRRDLLIDLSESDMQNNFLQLKNNKDYFQNTWVSFDDDNNQNNNDFGKELLVC